MPDRRDLPPPGSSMFLDRVREVLQSFMGRTGDKLDQIVTVRDLDQAGIATVHPRFAASGNGALLTDPTPDMTPPPPPTGFFATSGTTNILFRTDQPLFTMGHGYGRTVIYAANYSGSGPLPTFADAVEYYTFRGPIAAAPFDPAANMRLWAKWVSVDGAFSVPAGGTNGISAVTGLIDDFQIANLQVAKLLAGSLSVGQYIQSADYVTNTSGWRIQTLAGGQAFMEINGGATIGGLVVSADNIRSSNYVAGTTGYRFKSDGTGQIGGLIVTTNGVQSANYVAGVSGFRWDFSGVMEARSGTFAGSLSAATGTFAGSLSAATGTFAGSLSAATGTFSGLLSAAQISVGTAGTPTVFRDTSLGSIDLQSIAHGLVQFHGETKVVVGGVDTWPPVTGTNVTFTCGNGATPIARRVRSGTVRFQIVATAVADDHFSLWYRVNGGAWTFMYEVIEPQTSYGIAAAVSQLDRSMASGDTIEFGMAVTNSAGAPNDTTKTELRYANLAVQGINF